MSRQLLGRAVGAVGEDDAPAARPLAALLCDAAPEVGAEDVRRGGGARSVEAAAGLAHQLQNVGQIGAAQADARVQAVRRVADYDSAAGQQHQHGRGQQQQIIVTRRHHLQKRNGARVAHASDKYDKCTLSAAPPAFYHYLARQKDEPRV